MNTDQLASAQITKTSTQYAYELEQFGSVLDQGIRLDAPQEQGNPWIVSRTDGAVAPQPFLTRDSALRHFCTEVRDAKALALGDAPAPRPKLYFLHRRIIYPDSGEAALMLVTAVRTGNVYYRMYGGGGAEYCTLERWPQIAAPCPPNRLPR